MHSIEFARQVVRPVQVFNLLDSILSPSAPLCYMARFTGYERSATVVSVVHWIQPLCVLHKIPIDCLLGATAYAVLDGVLYTADVKCTNPIQHIHFVGVTLSDLKDTRLQDLT